MRLAALQQTNGLILHDVDSLSDACASHQLSSPTHPLNTVLFEADYWQSRGLVVGEAPGRGSSL
ncbi:MAG TPA: 3-deoxy-D-manno-octulosonic acid kinase, partial [Halomonas sp.]|nr:3-deoxy-D-manno-octulosonic acid kinase [Halomonas sp.]